MNRLLALALLLAACGCDPSDAPPPATAVKLVHAEDAGASPEAGGVRASSTSASNAPDAGNVEHLKLKVSPALQAVVDAPDRSPEDRQLDIGRHAGEMLSFFGVGPGMHTAELVAGGGYTTELLARAVGPSGVVYGVNPKFLLERFAEKPWSARLAKPAMKNVVRVDREIDDPLPPEAKDLDLVVNVLVYHDLVWLGGDRDKMNRAVFAALKRGGAYVVVDHSGRTDSGVSEVKTLHRIEERVVREEVLHAGFKLQADADFLRNPADTRDWNDSPMAAADRRGTSDRFALEFVKP